MWKLLGISLALIIILSSVPSVLATNENLYVSAENSQFDNYMSGAQVIEVIVMDENIDDTDIPRGEPDVTVNGKELRMVQAIDGNWYGYFADRTMAQIADSTVINENGQGLDFGDFCGVNGYDHETVLGIDLDDTVGFAVSNTGEISGVIGSSTGEQISNDCVFTLGTPENTMNVVRESKSVNLGNDEVPIGQIGLNDADNWPFIQLYSLNPTGNVVIQYNKGGGVQSTTLTFDTVDHLASLNLDKSIFTRNAQVHVTIEDSWLNIDPTDEDSWTFGTNQTNGLSTNYQVFDENGNEAGAAVVNGVINIFESLNYSSDLMIEDNGILILDVDAQESGTNVITIQDTLDSVITCDIPQDASTCITSGIGLGKNSQPITITEIGPNSGVFTTYDESDTSVIIMTSDAKRGTSATIDYNESPVTILTGFDFGYIDIQPIDDEWNSGEEIPVVLTDFDANKNSKADEDLDFYNPDVDIIPSLQTGNPFTLESLSTAQLSDIPLTVQEVQSFSQRAMLESPLITIQNGDSLHLTTSDTFADLYESINNPSDNFRGFNFFHYDLRSLFNNVPYSYTDSFDIDITDGTSTVRIASNVNSLNNNLIDLSTTDDIFSMNTLSPVQIIFTFSSITENITISANTVLPIAVDFFSFGFYNDGVSTHERIANQIVRFELEETGDDTDTFVGNLEFLMLNQLNILDSNFYNNNLDSVISEEPTFIVIEDLTDEDAPRINYLDLGADGVSTQIADQEEAPTHSGVVSFDVTSYEIGDIVTVTLEDMDLSTYADGLIEIYTVVSDVNDAVFDKVGKTGLPTDLAFGDLGHLLDITYDEELWTSPALGTCDSVGDGTGIYLEDITENTGLLATGFALVETFSNSGVFVGDFKIPVVYCPKDSTQIKNTAGVDVEVNYIDFRDASGEIIKVGDSAGVRANTGSISLDRTVYPVPFGSIDDFDDPIGDQVTPAGSNPDETRSLNPIHATGITDNDLDEEHETLGNGDLIIHIRITDADFDLLESEIDKIEQDVTGSTVGLVKISIIRDSEETILGYAGGSTPNINGVIDVNADATGSELDDILQLGAMYEIAPDAGIFEIDFTIRYSDGSSSAICPDTDYYVKTDGVTRSTDPLIRFDSLPINEENFCILQGDILQVEYTDPTDASGEQNILTDSATFDLRNGVLQSDKSVYTIGSDMILTLIEPDFDLDNDLAETYDLDLIEWDSDAATLTMGDAGGQMSSFDPEPLYFIETGDSTGIFQVVIEIPESLGGDNLERGEEIVLEYNDWAPSGSNYVGEEELDVNVTIFTSNFGATVELDQSVYTWTDKVYITIVAPDHNFNINEIDSIGKTDLSSVKITTRGHELNNYELVETGTNTGIFTGEVILTGFCHDADGDTSTGDGLGECPVGDDTNPVTSGVGPIDGLIKSDNDDGLTVSFEFSEDETVVGSALIRWNIGEVQWIQTNIVRVIDADMNLNPEAVNSFNIDVWSDTDAGGITLNVTETNVATGIYEGTVYFTTTDESSDHILRVAEGDTVTAEYEDNTLPDPYTTSDELDITATIVFGGVIIPDTTISIETDKTAYTHNDIIYLSGEALPSPINIDWNIDNLDIKIVDAFGNIQETITVDQQVQFTSTIINNQNSEQTFSYLVRVQDDTGATMSLAWITGSLAPYQSFSPALSWIPTENGDYTASAFFWESVDYPTVLHPNISLTFNVGSDDSNQQIIYTDSEQIPIVYYIVNPSGSIATVGEILSDETGSFSEQIITTSTMFGSFGEYSVRTFYGDSTSETSFSLVANLYCNDMTIDELIASENYNVIDNRDGHLDGTRILGTNGDDLILASDAGNVIHAKKGNDCVIGGSGNDKLLGEQGNDTIFGESGNDNIRGGSGDDTLSCGDGVDKANGEQGTDTATLDCETIKQIP